MQHTMFNGRTVSAASTLLYLLILTQRAADRGLWSELIALAERIVSHPSFLPRHQDGLTRTAWQLVDDAIWPEALASPVLDQLKLKQPQSADHPSHTTPASEPLANTRQEAQATHE
jgi:hypothetical protein